MKSLIKKTAVLVFALVLMVSTASTVLAWGGGGQPGPEPGSEWDPSPGRAGSNP
ncbi:MAG: hypothetical protein LWX54_05185 [Deltaproteobacteria bacterium]|jgi:hypothetical protein|nr:hypothetical protein [Deltaproteobacteria bacterium]